MLTATIEELRSIALGADDASGYFAALYARVTERIQLAAAAGRFDDPDRMEEFARSFVSWFTRARPETVSIPRCWRATFDVADDGHLLIVQHLLLGINAHVNHDLPQVVVESAAERGGLDALRSDFDAVNDVLAETLPMVVRSLGRVSRWVNLAAGRGGGQVFHFSLEVARAQAWRSAQLLDRLAPEARRRDADDLDRVVSVLSHLIARPGRPASWVIPLGRRLEQSDPPTVTVELLGHLA